MAGAAGSGKTTLAALVARVLRVPHIEIDGLFHGPGWTVRESFESDVAEFVARPAWVTEYQYAIVRDRLTDRIDLLIWLDLPRPVVMRQVTLRTLRRRLLRERLWPASNVEPPLHTFFADPEHIVRWAWNTHDRTTPRVAAARARRPDLPVVRLRSHREVRTWLARPLMAAAYPGVDDV